MKLIIGIGNPEARFDNTRHNVGFHMLDSLAKEFGVQFESKKKFNASVAETVQSGEKVLLVKPTTFYNLSGDAVRSLMDFYKLDVNDILVIHDDLALPIGSLRTRIGGSDAGNNGIKSINAAVGEATSRIRIGIWTDHRNRVDDVDFVLGKFSREEQQILGQLLPKVLEFTQAFVSGSFEATTHRAD